MKAQAEKEVSVQSVYGHDGPDRLGWSVVNWGKILSWVVVLLPLLLWLPRYSMSELFGVPGLYVTMAKIGSLTGTAMMAWSIILSARFHWLDKSFKGLDKLYKLHHQFGALAFTLIMWHALWLTIKFQANTGNAWASLWLSDSLPVRLGIVAFGLLIALIFATVMIQMKYDTFVRVHKFLGVVFVIGAAHAFSIGGQMAINPSLRYYMLILCGIALLSFVYHSVFGQLLVMRYRYKVKDVHHLGNDVLEICLKRAGRPMLFAPGQFAYLSFDVKGLAEPHPYSISSGNRENLVRFTVKALGDYTKLLQELKPGTKATIEGPFGGFSYLNAPRKEQVWVAGGIGITPFLSMARSLKRGYHADLYYCVKTESEMVFAQELLALSDNEKVGFHLQQICEDTDGFISASTISKVSGELSKKDFFICGPPVMADALTKQLKELGVSDDQIHYEDFRY
jgi:predicted ferric reductase